MEIGSESEVFETVGGLLDSIGNALSTIFELLNLILGLDGDLNSLAATFEIIGAVLDAISTIINGIADTIKFIIALIKGENFVDALEKAIQIQLNRSTEVEAISIDFLVYKMLVLLWNKQPYKQK